ncbi:glucose 1-dehydrogenase [Cetobacterium sp. 8H]|uniref:glucose 1-dehydrogenase n=1 Tax=Cetobacterium sp. 8H TaxID=2759681 RepID=UPI00163C120A|nr:glucose 1-dehydrogenase [Cetobacterium sp. 8H]MBC2849892.1 glucose 1-dehydrogenase [Cetobacterium sp. 8H]
MLDLFGLKGKVAIVTGASSGIGQSMAIGLAKAGAKVVVVDIMNLDETEKKIKECDGECEKINANLFELEISVNKIVEETLRKYGSIDILVNNAGIQRRNPAMTFIDKDWDDVMQINLKAVFKLSQAVAPIMKKKGKGKIINMASLLSFQGGYTVPAYAASKGGVAQLTKALSNEWAKLGINVNAIAPGYVATDMNKALIDDEQRNRQILERIPAGRWAKPDDYMGGVIFLASSASDYINGEIICIDGGWMGR